MLGSTARENGRKEQDQRAGIGLVVHAWQQIVAAYPVTGSIARTPGCAEAATSCRAGLCDWEFRVQAYC